MKKTLNRLVSLALAVVALVSAVAITSVTATAAADYNYEIKVQTGNKLGAGTDANVYLYAYDAQGNLITGGRISLDTDGDSFEKGDTDIVNLTLPQKIDHIKVAIMQHHGNMFVDLDNSVNEWYLNNIEVTLDNGEKKVFTFNQWIEPGYYEHTRTIRDRHSFPKLRYEKVPEQVIIYSPSGVN